MLTRGFFRYVHDLRRAISGSLWSVTISPPEPDYADLLRDFISTSRGLKIFDQLKPRNPQYELLSEKLTAMADQAQKVDFKKIPFERTIRPGDTSYLVPMIRKRLRQAGDLNQFFGINTGNQYGLVMEQAIKQFKKRFGLPDDGMIDRRTMAALNVKPELIMEKIRTEYGQAENHATLPTREGSRCQSPRLYAQLLR